MTAPLELEAKWLQVYGGTRSKAEACRACGVSTRYYLDRQKADPDFREKMMHAATQIDDRVQAAAIDALLNGARYQVLGPDGGAVELRKAPSAALQLRYLERFCSWGGESEEAHAQNKELVLLGRDGRGFDILDLIRGGLRAGGAQINTDETAEEDSDGDPE